MVVASLSTVAGEASVLSMRAAIFVHASARLNLACSGRAAGETALRRFIMAIIDFSGNAMKSTVAPSISLVSAVRRVARARRSHATALRSAATLALSYLPLPFHWSESLCFHVSSRKSPSPISFRLTAPPSYSALTDILSPDTGVSAQESGSPFS